MSLSKYAVLSFFNMILYFFTSRNFGSNSLGKEDLKIFYVDRKIFMKIQ